MSYLNAWLVVLGAGLGVIGGVFVLTRRIRWFWVRTGIRCLVPVWLLLPAQIQVVDAHYAPAFIVVVFESLFRADGNPGPAAATLGAGTAVVLATLLIAAGVRLRRGRAAQAATDPPDEDTATAM